VIERAVILNDIAEPMGGATAPALLSAYQLRGRGLAVTFIAGDAGDNLALAAAGVDIVALGQTRLKAAGLSASDRKAIPASRRAEDQMF